MRIPQTISAILLVLVVALNANARQQPDETIIYKTVDDVSLSLHVYYPPGHSKADKTPAIVFFHGGGWNKGKPAAFFRQSAYLASRGMVAISAEYRLRDVHGTTVSDAVSDAKSALRWVRSHAGDLGVNPDMLAAGGGSAGGHLAAATGTLGGYDDSLDDLKVSARPDALVLFNPVYDNGPDGYGHRRLGEDWEKLSPLHNISASTPPAVVFFGTEDKTTPVQSARNFKAAMEAVGVRSDLHLYEGQKHSFFNKLKYTETLFEADRFLTSLGYLSGRPTINMANTPKTGKAVTQKPNILLIMAEDMSPRVGYHGDAVARTPNIDKLASEGLAYMRTFTASGVCAPSRSAFIMGAHQQTFGAHQMRAKNEGYLTVPPVDYKAFPELLRRAGYYVTNNSKTDYQMGEPFTIWDESGNNAHWRNRPEGKPFFHMITYNVTHESFTWPSDGELPAGTAENFAIIYEKNAARNGKIQAKQSQSTKPSDVVVPPWLPDEPVVRQDIARHYNNIEYMDSQVGQTLARLEEDGLLGNTIVIWTTDHGDGLPRAKRSLYDSGIHVPMVIRFPDGYRAGEKTDELITFVDLGPTLLALAGSAPAPHMQGNVFLGNDRDAERTYIHAAADRHDEVPDRVRVVRSDRFKYFRNYQPEKALFQHLGYRNIQPTMRAVWAAGAAGTLSDHQVQYLMPRQPEELYDLDKDPNELSNLAGDPTYAAVLKELRAEMDRFQAEHGDMGALPESEMKETMWPGGRQPKTATPVAEVRGGKLYLTSPTKGASIGYRLASDPAGMWRLYTDGIELQGEGTVSFKAERYGFKESKIVSHP